jgi:hypothetical protein
MLEPAVQLTATTTVAVTTAPLSIERPFPVTVNPAQLTRRLRPRDTEAG